MTASLPKIPNGGIVTLSRARVPAVLLEADFPISRVDGEGNVLVDLDIDNGLISRISEASDRAAQGSVDLEGGQVWPAFVDIHTHLDKAHISPRAGNPDGTVYGAVQSVASDRQANWSANDVRRRFEFGLRCAYAHGTAAIRTHLDSDGPQAAISWPVFAELRAEWAGKIDLQGVGKAPLEYYLTPEGENFAGMVSRYGGLLGGVTRIYAGPEAGSEALLEAAIDALFRLAERYHLDIDLHVDETGDPAANSLKLVAAAAIRRRFPHRVLCGHCCSLATQSWDTLDTTLDLCAESGLAVVTLPMINMYLQDRASGRTPRWRGVAPVHELAARGIPVAAASDNCRDPFFAYGDHDMLEVYAQAVRIAHLDAPYGNWPRAVTATPADLMGLKKRGLLSQGVSADLVLFRGRTMAELLSRPQPDRIVLRAGNPIDTALPDYRELDELFAI